MVFPLQASGSPIGTSIGRAGGAGESGSLEVWRLGSLVFFSVIPLCLLARRRRAGGAGRTSPCRGVGQRPTSLQSTNLQISQLPFVSFVSFVIAAQREACTNFQTSKLLSFQSRVLRAIARRPPLCPSVLSVLLCVSPKSAVHHSGSPLCPFVVLRVLCDSRVAWSLSKLLNLQTSKLPNFQFCQPFCRLMANERRARSAGLTPGMEPARRSESGRIRSSFSRASKRRPRTAA